jgi:hypothetical protein
MMMMWGTVEAELLFAASRFSGEPKKEYGCLLLLLLHKGPLSTTQRGLDGAGPLSTVMAQFDASRFSGEPKKEYGCLLLLLLLHKGPLSTTQKGLDRAGPLLTVMAQRTILNNKQTKKHRFSCLLPFVNGIYEQKL